MVFPPSPLHVKVDNCANATIAIDENAMEAAFEGDFICLAAPYKYQSSQVQRMNKNHQDQIDSESLEVSHLRRVLANSISILMQNMSTPSHKHKLSCAIYQLLGAVPTRMLDPEHVDGAEWFVAPSPSTRFFIC